MKNIYFLIPLILLFSCSKDVVNDPIKVLTEANKAALKVNSASFILDYKFIQNKEKFDAKVKVFVQRVNREGYPYNIRLEYDGGIIAVYNGDQYRWFDPQSKKVTFVPKDKTPELFIERNWVSQAIKMVVQNEDRSKEIKDIKDTMKIVGMEKYDNNEVVKLYRTQYFSDYDSRLTSYEFYDYSKKLPIKDSTIQISMGDTIQFIYEIHNLKLNNSLENSLFVLEPDNQADLVNYNIQETNKLDSGMAPNFELLDGSGKKVSLESLKGKVLVLDFWGTWCKWCVKSMPHLESLRKEYSNNKSVEVIGISCQEPPNADPVKFMRDNSINYRTLLKGDDVASKFGVDGFPTLFVINKEGKIVHTLVGYQDDMQQVLSNIIKNNL